MPFTDKQQSAFTRHYRDRGVKGAWFDETRDRVIRYLRTRRIRAAIEQLERMTVVDRSAWSVLVLCAGSGGEGSMLADLGFTNVVVSDFCEEPLLRARARDPRLCTAVLDAERLQVEDGSFDLVIVQDGLHHLPRPTVGLTEMLRAARRAAIVIEPSDNVVTRCVGGSWEVTAGVVNYVFRWNRRTFEQVIQSFCLFGGGEKERLASFSPNTHMPYRLPRALSRERSYRVKVLCLWDHHSMMMKLYATPFGRQGKLALMRLIYGCVYPFNWIGNAFIGILVKQV